MMPAAKHGDPQLGIDIHLCIVPPGATVPLPTPHLSVVFDPFDYLPLIGATTTVMGMKRACAGTSGIVVHIPPGFPFAKPPEKDDELFMGSATVIVDGDPFSHISHPVLGCQVAGMPSPGRVKKKPKKMCLLPTEFNLAIPSTVLIGGPPTISLAGLLTKGAFKALGTLAKKLGPSCSKLMKRFKAWRKAKWGHLPPGFLKCVILRAEPVDILTGAVSVEQQDFALSGRLPFDWLRGYSSNNLREGLCGIGWETPLDGRLEYDPESRSVGVFYPGIGPLYFDRLPRSVGEDAAELELMDGARLTDGGEHLTVRTKDDRLYRFRKADRLRRPDGYYEIPLEHIADRTGNTLRIARQDGTPTAIFLPGGRRLDLVVAGGRLRAVTLERHDTGHRHVFVRYDYDENGHLVTVFDAMEQPYTFAYDSGHRLLRHTDRNGLSFYYHYQSVDGEWRVDHAWGDGGLYDYRFEYQDLLRERRITDSLGHVALIKLNEDGLPINELDPLGGMTLFEYDECGRTCAVVDPAGRRTEYHYDERGNLVRLVRPDGRALVSAFDHDDKPVSIADALGECWQQRFDAHGQLIEQRSPLGHVSRYDYDTAGQLCAYTNPRGAITRLDYDAAGHLAQLTDALGHTTRFAHDVLGSLVGKIDALAQRTAYLYDAKGRLTEVTLPSGSRVRCGYDGEDNLTDYVDENGARTRLAYAGLGELTRRLQPDGHTVEYLYDTEERLIGVRNQRGELYQLKRDALGRVVEEVDYWGQSRRYGYDGSGHLLWSEDPLHRRIDYVCDPLGRILRKAFVDERAALLGQDGPAVAASSAAATPPLFVETFAYDANGNLTETANPHVKVTRQFDADGRMIEEAQAHTPGESFTVRNRYDAAGNRTQRQTESSAGPGHLIEYGFDLLDQSIEVRIDGGAPIRAQRDALGQITDEQLAPGLARRYRYDADGRMTEQSLNKDGQSLFATHYGYDRAGNLTQRSDSQFGIDRYVYDPMGRILEHCDPQGQLERFFNDPAGDRLITRVEAAGDTATQVNGRGDGWVREGDYRGVRYRFDRAGNLVEKCDANARLQLRWDANQRLIASRKATHEAAPVTYYAYDPLGRRLFKETNSRKTWFGWDGDVIAVDIIDGRPREFLFAPGTFEPLAMLDDTAQPNLYWNDSNGCPARLIDRNGNTCWAAAFSSWGRLTDLRVGSKDNPIRLQGQYADAETGFYYNRNRYFCSDSGSFVSTDPIGLLGGENIYGYGPNAIKWIDPLGLKCAITSKLQKFAKEAAAEAKLSPKQRASIQRSLDRAKNTSGAEVAYHHMMAAKKKKMYMGTQIDTLFKRKVEAADLPGIQTTPRGQFGPDVFDTTSKRYWDLTTKTDWAKETHQSKYNSKFGSGTGIFW